MERENLLQADGYQNVYVWENDSYEIKKNMSNTKQRKTITSSC